MMNVSRNGPLTAERCPSRTAAPVVGDGVRSAEARALRILHDACPAPVMLVAAPVSRQKDATT